MSAQDTAREIVRATVDGWGDFEKGGAESPYAVVEATSLIDAMAALYAECERQRKMLDALAPLAFHPEASRYLAGNVGDELKAWLKEDSPLDRLRAALATGASK